MIVQTALRRTWLTGTVLLLIGGLLAEEAAARTSCSYAGAPTNALTVTVQDDSVGAIKRSGSEITVRERGKPLARCAGGTPTVLNIDTINVVLADLSFVDLDLNGGPFAPGVTPEAEGASEIEIQISVDLGSADIVGTPGADEWHWGAGGANPGLNLNPRDLGDTDVDVTIKGDEDKSGPLLANGAGGDDTIIGAPGAVVRGSVDADGGAGNDLLQAPKIARGGLEIGSADMRGGAGNDTLIGSDSADDLAGGAGDDRIDGRRGADKITGGRGRDRISAGAGRDVVNSRDLSTDTVSCGSGRDRVNADRRDRLTGCENSRPR